MRFHKKDALLATSDVTVNTFGPEHGGPLGDPDDPNPGWSIETWPRPNPRPADPPAASDDVETSP